MSPLFSDMLDDLNEQSDLVELDFADEASFTLVLDFCRLADYSERQEFPRRLLKKHQIRTMQELFVENADSAEL